MKKKRIIILIGFMVVVLLYIAESIYLSAKVNALVKQSYDSYGQDNHFRDVVSDEIYKKMSYRNGYSISSFDTPNTKEIHQLSFPITIHWMIGGKTTYWYSYQIYDANNKLMGGSKDIPVTVKLKLQDGRWKLVDYREPL